MSFIEGAADVMYHWNCLKKYFQNFCNDVDFFTAFEIEDDMVFHDLVKNLGSTFQYLPATCTRIDIVLDLYKEKSIKSNGRDR